MRKAEYIIPALLIILAICTAAASTYLFPESDIKTIVFTNKTQDAFTTATHFADSIIAENERANSVTVSLSDPIKLAQLKAAGAFIITAQQDIQCLSK
jgi:hypothetical protein